MGMFAGAWTLLSLLALSRASDPINVLTRGLDISKVEEKLHALARNSTDATKNYTFVELINSFDNDTAEASCKDVSGVDRPAMMHRTNPHYERFSDAIDFEARRLRQVFPTYDPGAGDVSAECKRHSEIFQRELARFTLWALKMYDATAKVPSGLLSGNVNQLGDFDECIGVEGKDGIRGQYCLAQLRLSVDRARPDLKYLHRLLQSHYAFRNNVTDPKHRVPHFGTVFWGVCTPASCTSNDVEASFQHTISQYTAQTGLKISVHMDKEMCQVREERSLPTATVVTSFIFVAVFALTLVAAYCDHFKVPASELLLSFSLKRNIQKLFSLERPPDDIASLHGIRFLHTILLLVAHKSLALFFTPYTNRTPMAESLGRPWTVLSRAASMYTDPFIMLSGILTTYSFLNKIKKTGNLDIVNAYMSRLFRLLPTLGALILFSIHILPYIDSGPQWHLISSHANICKQTWWSSFLFIHNYIGFKNICLTHTHHVGIDMQLFAISPLMVLLLYKRPRIGVVVLGIVAMISTILRFYVTYVRELNNYIHYGITVKQMFDTADYSYILPSHRLTVYIIGVFTGYLLRSLPKNFKFSATALYTGWTVCTITFLLAMISPSTMGSIDYVYNPMDAATYNAFAPFGWCAIFIWIIIMQHTCNSNGFIIKLFSWRGFLVTTRISYAVYLTQFPIFFYSIAKTRTAEYYGFLLKIVNLREILLLVIASILFTLLFDTPFQNIRNYLFKKPVSQRDTMKSSKVE